MKNWAAELQMMHLNCSGHPFPLEAAQRCVGPGWADLVKMAYEALPDGSTILQVKEKYGGLRFYCSPDLPRISEIENLSETVCEECGLPGSTRNIRGWFRTLCKRCYDETHPVK